MNPSSDSTRERAPSEGTLPTHDERFVASEAQVSCTLGGEVVILEMRRGVYYGIEGVGARVWELLQAPASPREVLGILLREYEVEAARCERDLLEIIGKLRDAGLIRKVDGSA